MYKFVCVSGSDVQRVYRFLKPDRKWPGVLSADAFPTDGSVEFDENMGSVLVSGQVTLAGSLSVGGGTSLKFLDNLTVDGLRLDGALNVYGRLTVEGSVTNGSGNFASFAICRQPSILTLKLTAFQRTHVKGHIDFDGAVEVNGLYVDGSCTVGSLSSSVTNSYNRILIAGDLRIRRHSALTGDICVCGDADVNFLALEGSLRVDGSLVATPDLRVDHDLVVGCNAYCAADLYVGWSMSVNSGLCVGGVLIVKEDLAVKGDSVVFVAVSVSGRVDVYSGVLFSRALHAGTGVYVDGVCRSVDGKGMHAFISDLKLDKPQRPGVYLE